MYLLDMWIPIRRFGTLGFQIVEDFRKLPNLSWGFCAAEAAAAAHGDHINAHAENGLLEFDIARLAFRISGSVSQKSNSKDCEKVSHPSL